GRSCDDGVAIHRFPILRWPGRRYVLKALSLVPLGLWQCMTMPCNPIAPRMWSEAGRRKKAFDVVHATAFPYAWPLVCGLRLAHRQRVPFLLTPFLHLGDPENREDETKLGYTTPALLSLIHAADRVFVQTPGERQALLDRGISAEKLVLLGMGVAPEECTGGDRDKGRRAWGVNPEEVVIGHLANNSEEKGTVDLLRAAQLMWQRGRRFHVVPAGPEMPNFQQFWRKFRPAGPVGRLGVLSDEARRDFFASLDIFALPSRSDSFGLVLLEAWANG